MTPQVIFGVWAPVWGRTVHVPQFMSHHVLEERRGLKPGRRKDQEAVFTGLIPSAKPGGKSEYEIGSVIIQVMLGQNDGVDSGFYPDIPPVDDAFNQPASMGSFPQGMESSEFSILNNVIALEVNRTRLSADYTNRHVTR